MPDDTEALREQLSYYSARAEEYDQWWLRLGRYDRGHDANREWFAEAAELASALEAFGPSGKILELACGTGLWSERLARHAATLSLVDGSSEMLRIAEKRLRPPIVSSPLVSYTKADLFQWQPTEVFDTVFFSFWLSHVPPERFTGFWDLVRRCVAPDGRVFFIDSLHEPTSTAANHFLPQPEAVMLRRKLNDGREFQIYKVYYEPAELERRLRELGWEIRVQRTAKYFLYGHGSSWLAPPK